MIDGRVHVHVERAVKIRSLDVHLQGQEKVVIDPPMVTPVATYHKAHYSSTNEMLNVGLRLLEDTTLEPGERDLRFQFQLRSDALPSYIGTYASVNWKLSARADIPWGGDLSDLGYLRILAVHSANPTPLILENPEAKPKLRLELPRNIYAPGDVIEGKLTLIEPGNLRTARVQIVQREDATARGTFTDAHKSQNRNIGNILEIRRDSLQVGCSMPFQLQLPQLAPSDYNGIFSAVTWWIEAVLDIPHSEDVRISAPFLVGLRERPKSQQEGTAAPRTVEQVSSPEKETPEFVSRFKGSTSRSGPGETETVTTMGPSTPSYDDKQVQDARAVIIQILGDGSSKDLITISTELQAQAQGFLDLNQVRKLCEELVTQGRLVRTGEGEFFAKYSFTTQSPP